jgi:hypothetical protein
MEIKNIKMLAIGSFVFTLINIWWVYLYTWTGIRFSDAFDPKIALKFTGPNAITLILLLLAIGFMIALSIFLARLFSLHLNKLERTIMVAVGVILPIAACLSFFNNTLVFLIIMLFYMAGCMLLVYSKHEGGKSWSKMKSNYNASKNVVTFLAIGSLVASLLFVYMNLDDSKAKFKEAMLSFQSSINLGSILTKDDVRKMVIDSGQLLTKEQIRQSILTGANVTEEQVAANPTLATYVNEQVDKAYALQYEQLDKTIDSTYEKLTNNSTSMTRPIMEKMFANPPFSYLFDFLPILIALVITSLVSSFGAIWISPMSGALGAFMPNPPNAPEPPKPPEAKK